MDAIIWPGTYRLRNVKSGTYLDSNHDTTTIHGWDSRPNNESQKWIIETSDMEPTGFTIRNFRHGRYICATSESEGAEVTVDDYSLFWVFGREEGGWTGNVLRKEGGAGVGAVKGVQTIMQNTVSLRNFDGGPQQLWVLEAQGGSQSYQYQQDYQHMIAPTDHYVYNALTGAALDLAGGKADDGTPIFAYSPHGQLNQTWVFEYGNRGYRVRNKASGTYLGYGDLNEGVSISGHKHPFEWVITVEHGRFQFHPVGNDTQLIIDLAEGRREDGAKIFLFPKNNVLDNGANQKWRIERVSMDY
ncbi:hypothetical protein FRB90_010993 [Tulasnella sp. 427]|nr:hypothetical protein FRB90_010993 [Tulasnella sp. 427]